MEEKERTSLLVSSGLTAEQAADANTFIAAMPTVHAEIKFEVDGQGKVMEGDMVVATVRAVLTRPTHQTTGFDVDGRTQIPSCA
jgi:translocation protein SEC63